MLNPTQKDIQELQKEFEDDARERAKEIALSEKLDNELLKKREALEMQNLQLFMQMLMEEMLSSMPLQEA